MVSDQNTKLKNILTKSNTNISRDIPLNVGAEQSLLGAILSNNLALEKVEDFRIFLLAKLIMCILRSVKQISKAVGRSR